jgi:hypothetical protein
MTKKEGYTKIAVKFEDKLFRRIKSMADREHKCFSDMAAELCRVGILDLEDSDRHEIVYISSVTNLDG